MSRAIIVTSVTIKINSSQSLILLFPEDQPIAEFKLLLIVSNGQLCFFSLEMDN